MTVAVVNVQGRVFMEPSDDPFRTVKEALARISTPVVVVDVHAEATSEKKAMGYHLAGRVSAVIGTHTHVQTSDEVVLAQGTAYITDAGMTGIQDSVLGLDKNMALSRFLTQIPGKFTLAEGTATLQGVVVDIDGTSGRATSIERISVEESEL